MSYNQKPPGPGGSGMGGSGVPPNGPNNMPQVAKTFAGIQQQMQNFVHGQNPLPQSSQADLNAFLQQQRIQSMLKQQQQFLHFQQQMQQQQQQQHQQQQQQQHHNMSGGGVGVSASGAGGGPGVGGGGGGGSGEPLALTRTPGAAELLNKTYQQTANGNPGATSTLNQLQQTLQALPTNFVQQLQAFQYQMQAKQIHQHAQGGNQQGGGAHLPQQQGGVPQGVPPPPTTGGSGMSHQQQQQQQKHHQQQNALSTVAAVQQFQQRYLSAAAAQAAANSNKLSSATPPPPPPLTNQMKPPNLPPNTQISPVSGANIGTGVIPPSIASAHQKGPASGTNKHQTSQPPPSISLTPSKIPTTSAPSAAHQQNKFTPPQITGTAKGSHSSAAGHAQNLPKPPYSGGSNAFNNATSPTKGGTNVDTAATGAALKSPQSTPVQLTKQMPTAATTATIGNKMGATTTHTATSTGAATTMVSPQKPPSTTTLASSITTNTTTITTTSAAAQQPVASISGALNPPTPIVAAAKSPLATPEAPTKAIIADKVVEKSQPEDSKSTNAGATSGAALISETNKKGVDKPTVEKKAETKESTATPKTPLGVEISNDTKSNVAVKLETKSTDQNKVEIAEAKSPKLENVIISDGPKNNNEETAEVVTVDAKEAAEKKFDANKEVKLPIPSATAAASSPIEAAPKIESDVKKSEPQNDVKKSVEDKVSDKKPDDKKEETEDIKSENNGTIPQPVPIAVAQPKSDTVTSLPSEPVKVVEKVSEATTEKSNQNADQKTKFHHKTVKPVTEEKEAEKKSTIISYSSESAEATAPIKDVAKENEDQPKALPLKIAAGKSEVVAVTKADVSTTKPASANEATEEVIDTTATAAVAATVTPVKKQSRSMKIAKSKSNTTASEVKIPEKPTEKSTPAAVRTKRKLKIESYASDSTPSTLKDDASDRKSKRHRLKTILYQSPLPELAFITKLSASEASNSPKPMSNEDRLIVFYKNEYMAVRNAEGTFYLCQTMQNVYRTSPRISIRWLSEDPKDSNVYIPDFYDHTDIECVLTTVELKRIDKGHMRLPKTEKTRIESILKKAIDVEKGLVPRPELTAENPDGLDISLFKDESQIEKKSLANADDQSGVTSGATGVGRKSRRGGNSHATSVAKPAAQTPSTTAGYKRKRSSAGSAVTASSTSARKSPAKKRKTLVKRKKKKSNVSDDDGEDDEETSDDYESDTEYKPSQKRSSLNASASKSTPRAQRSPLAKARAASPITPTTSRSRNVPQKVTPTPSPSTSKATRGERAAKRKSLTEIGSSEETPPPAKRPSTTSASSTTKAPNKTKTSENVSLEQEEANAASIFSSDIKASEISVTTTPNTSNPNCSSAQKSVIGSSGATCGGDGGGATNGGNSTPPRSRK